MAKIFEPKLLNRRLYRYGPYIYSGNFPGFNKNNSDYMNKKASEYPYLAVFRIGGTKYLYFCSLTPIKAICNGIYIVMTIKKMKN